MAYFNSQFYCRLYSKDFVRLEQFWSLCYCWGFLGSFAYFLLWFWVCSFYDRRILWPVRSIWLIYTFDRIYWFGTFRKGFCLYTEQAMLYSEANFLFWCLCFMELGCLELSLLVGLLGLMLLENTHICLRCQCKPAYMNSIGLLGWWCWQSWMMVVLLKVMMMV